MSWLLLLCCVCALLDPTPYVIEALVPFTPVLTLTHKSKNRRTIRLRAKQRIHLEASPLIGGPSWLPLHVKVVVERPFVNDTAAFSLRHKWDLIPVNATSEATLQQLLLLRTVPSQIRYRLYSSVHDVDEKIQLPELLLSIVYDSNTLQEMSHDFLLTVNKFFEAQTLSERCSTPEVYVKDETQRRQPKLQQVHDFCLSYLHQTRMELHLITNNCWRFALQLYFYLLLIEEDEK